MKTISRLLLSSVLALAVLTGCSEKPTETVATAAVVAAPIPVKFVVVTMFEIGEDTGDKAGEFQLWKERQKLDTRFPFPNGYHDIYMNETTGVMGIVTGIGTAYSTASIMALGMDKKISTVEKQPRYHSKKTSRDY